jgi:hypothetical protein
MKGVDIESVRIHKVLLMYYLDSVHKANELRN